MLKKTLYKHTREFLERNLPENFFLFKKSNKKRIKYFSLKTALIKLNLSKLKLNKNKGGVHLVSSDPLKTFSLYEEKAHSNFPNKTGSKYTSKDEFDRKFLFNLYTIKSQFEKRQTRNSDFKNKLKEKKKLAILYGNLSNKHIKHALQKATKQTGNISINLLYILEKRLDIILYRALFFPTINTAKQWLSHNKVTVNSVFTNVPSYMVRPGDIIGVSKGNRKDVCNNMIKYFIHYKLIQNTNISINTDEFALNNVNTYTETNRKAYTNQNTLVMPHISDVHSGTNVNLSSACITIINNLNITLKNTLKFALYKKSLSENAKNFLYLTNNKYKRNLNIISIISLFEYKPFKLQENLNFVKSVAMHKIKVETTLESKKKLTLMPSKLISSLESSALHNNGYAHLKTHLKKNTKYGVSTLSEKLVFHFFLEKINDKYKLNLYKAFLNIKHSDLNHKLRNYNSIFYFKIENLKYVYKYLYSYNFIMKKILSVKHNFKLKPRTIINSFYFKVLSHQINFNNAFLYVKMVNFLKNRLLINDISRCTISVISKYTQLKKTHKKNMFNTYVYNTSINIFNSKCKILMTKINYKIKSVVLNIINPITAFPKKNNDNSSYNMVFNEYINTKANFKQSILKRLGKINNEISETKYYDFLFFLKVKKFFTEYTVHSTQYDKKQITRNKIHTENLPNYYNNDNSEFSGKINIKPLNLEISYRTLTIIYLFPPQKLIFPCALDMELLVKYDI